MGPATEVLPILSLAFCSQLDLALQTLQPQKQVPSFSTPCLWSLSIGDSFMLGQKKKKYNHIPGNQPIALDKTQQQEVTKSLNVPEELKM